MQRKQSQRTSVDTADLVNQEETADEDADAARDTEAAESEKTAVDAEADADDEDLAGVVGRPAVLL